MLEPGSAARILRRPAAKVCLGILVVVAAAAAIGGGEQAAVLEIQQGLQVRVGPQQHVAAAAAVAAGGPSGGHIFLAAERHDAVAAAAGLHRDAGLIDELHCSKPRIAPHTGPEAAKEIG